VFSPIKPERFKIETSGFQYLQVEAFATSDQKMEVKVIIGHEIWRHKNWSAQRILRPPMPSCAGPLSGVSWASQLILIVRYAYHEPSLPSGHLARSSQVNHILHWPLGIGWPRHRFLAFKRDICNILPPKSYKSSKVMTYWWLWTISELDLNWPDLT